MPQEIPSYKTLLPPECIRENCMGPNPLRMLEELLSAAPLPPGARVLDLGCGRGITSMYLAKAWGAQVFALDLWIQPGENYARIREMGLEASVIPLLGDANALPFSPAYFDALVCIDAYHYFGRQPGFLSEKILPFLKPGGRLYIALPGLAPGLSHDALPPALLQSWSAEDLACFQTAAWWQGLLKGEQVETEGIWELSCFQAAWADWLSTDNPYAQGDRAAMEAGAGEHMRLIGMLLRRLTA